MKQFMYLIAVLVAALSVSAMPAPAQFYAQGLGGRALDTESYLGVYLGDVDGEKAEELNLPAERGAFVGQVISDTPADEAGLQEEDVIVEWNGTPVEGARALQRLVAETPVGREVAAGVIREGEKLTVEIAVGRRPAPASPGWGLDPGAPLHGMPFGRVIPYGEDMPEWHDDLVEEAQRPRLGVHLQELPEQLAAFFGLEGAGGVLISSVLEDSPAHEAGLKAGDILLEIDSKPVEHPREVQRLLADKTGLADLTIFRDREKMDLGVRLGGPEEENEESEDPKPAPAYPSTAM